jgi:pSer/pThr/pTyr-binding forkhead associated (FHA) protein
MIGTLPSNTLVVSPRGGLISRSHAQINLRISEVGGPTFLLYDTSKNGTFVNGLRIAEPHALAHEDYIGLAGNAVVLQFLRHGETATATRLASYDPLTR